MDLMKTQRGFSFIRIKKTPPLDFSKFLAKKDQKPTESRTQINPNITLGTADAKDLVPKFKTLNKIEFEDAEIYAGLIRDPTSKNGLRYVIIEPQLSRNDETTSKL